MFTCIVSSCWNNFECILVQARKGSDEKTATIPKQSRSDSAAGSMSSPSKTSQRDRTSEDVIGPSPKKNPVPTKTSSKLALMKKRDEERDEQLKSKTAISPTKMIISPKKEPVTPKTGVTPTAVKISPKKPEVKNINVF